MPRDLLIIECWWARVGCLVGVGWCLWGGGSFTAPFGISNGPGLSPPMGASILVLPVLDVPVVWEVSRCACAVCTVSRRRRAAGCAKLLGLCCCYTLCCCALSLWFSVSLSLSLSLSACVSSQRIRPCISLSLHLSVSVATSPSCLFCAICLSASLYLSHSLSPHLFLSPSLKWTWAWESCAMHGQALLRTP